MNLKFTVKATAKEILGRYVGFHKDPAKNDCKLFFRSGLGGRIGEALEKRGTGDFGDRAMPRRYDTVT